MSPLRLSPPASAPKSASSNSSPPTSATSTRAAPTRRRRGNSWPGARAPASRRSPTCSRCTSPPISSSSAAKRSAPTVKQRLAAIRHLFDWLVTGQVIPVNPAASVRGPSHSVKRGKTPVLDPSEARALLDSIDVTTPVGLRDRALIGLMVYSFARIGAALAMKVEDVYVQNRRLWVRLHEKGGKRHEMPCHHNLETYLHAYIDGCGLAADPKGPLFRTIGRGTDALTTTPLPQANAYAMIRRRAAAADIATKIGNHTFRATGITAYLKNGGTLEKAAAMANHASTRTTQLYDRRRDDVSLDEVERILI